MASLTAGSTDPQHRTRPDGGWVLLGVVLYCYLLFFQSWKYIPRRFHCSDFLNFSIAV